MLEKSLPTKLKTRIAPTPSGFLHLGNARSFLLSWLIARKSGGQLLLRIDDMDADRYRPEYADDVFESLQWLGIGWDEGPQNRHEFEVNWSQKHFMDDYLLFLEKLKSTGCLFACGCSRAKIAKESTNGRYMGSCRDAGLPFESPETAWRIKTQPDSLMLINDFLQGPIKIDLHECMRDFVVRRKDGLPAYQVFSLVEDLRRDVNFIVRGEDLMESTAAQMFLSEKADEKKFTEAVFLHHPLLTDAVGQKLSKSAGAFSLKELRAGGGKASEVYRETAVWLGMENVVCQTLGDLLDRFHFGLPFFKMKTVQD